MYMVSSNYKATSPFPTGEYQENPCSAIGAAIQARHPHGTCKATVRLRYGCPGTTLSCVYDVSFATANVEVKKLVIILC